jgi:hypothetical protein
MTRAAYAFIELAEEAYLAAVVAYVLWRGAGTVRLAAAVVLGQWTLLLGFSAVHLGPAAHGWIEVLGLIGWAALCLRRPTPWLLWACAFQVADVATYGALLFDHSIRRLAALTALNTWSILSLLPLVWAAGEADRRSAPAGFAVPAQERAFAQGAGAMCLACLAGALVLSTRLA